MLYRLHRVLFFLYGLTLLDLIDLSAGKYDCADSVIVTPILLDFMEQSIATPR